jgi:hypothetical protein
VDFHPITNAFRTWYFSHSLQGYHAEYN